MSDPNSSLIDPAPSFQGISAHGAADGRLLKDRPLLEGLRARIRAIEQRPAQLAGLINRSLEIGGVSGMPPHPISAARLRQDPASSLPATGLLGSDAWRPGNWDLGAPALDGWLPVGGLDPAALHEVKPHQHRDWPAAIAFTLRLAARQIGALRDGGRREELERASAGRRPARSEAGASGLGSILWCWPAALANEVGRLYVPGLAALGIEFRSLIIVEPARTADVLWALEEGLKSRALALVVGGLPEVGLNSGPASQPGCGGRRHPLPAAHGSGPDGRSRHGNPLAHQPRAKRARRFRSTRARRSPRPARARALPGRPASVANPISGRGVV